MKKQILKNIPFLIAILSFNINVVAQDQHQKEPQRQKKGIDAIIDSLNLDEDKAAEFKTLHEERRATVKAERKERMEMKKNHQAQRAELYQIQKESYSEYQDKLKELLTEEELQQLYSMHNNHRSYKGKDASKKQHYNKTPLQDGKREYHKNRSHHSKFGKTNRKGVKREHPYKNHERQTPYKEDYKQLKD